MTLNPELIALLVHDLKNPLAALMSNLGFVASAVKDDEMTAEAVLDCVLSTEVLQRLIENVSAMGTLEGSAGPTKADCTVSEVIAAVNKRMGRHAETSMFRLVTGCDGDVGRVNVSARLLELALDNLVAASMAYAPASSTVDLRARRVDAGTVAIAVLDDGAAVDDAQLESILRKESQVVVKSAKGARYGRAFGIYVANLVAESCGGRLSVDQVDGRTAFELLLPAQG